jgi:hypothetical protein
VIVTIDCNQIAPRFASSSASIGAPRLQAGIPWATQSFMECEGLSCLTS